MANFAAELDKLPTSRAIRDGGDEFILFGAPGHRGMMLAVEDFFQKWPTVFQQRFGADVPPVRPRCLVGTSLGKELVAAREQLGSAIVGLKSRTLGPGGLLVESGRLVSG